MWNHARTEAEIASTINMRLATAQTGLVGRWSLDEGTGTLVRGSAGTSLDGTITGADWSWTGSAPFDVVIGPPVVAAPSGLAGSSPNSLTIDLSWVDESNNETSFEIERSDAGLVGPFTLQATVGQGEVSWTDVDVDASTEYCYRVRAVNPHAASDWSATACVTTLAETDHALSFGGTHGYVTFGEAPELGLEQFTIETWFRRDGLGELASTGGIVAVPLMAKGPSCPA